MGFLGLFSKKEEKEPARHKAHISLSPLASIEGRVIAAFTNVRQDVSLLSSWVKYLRHKDMLGEQRHTKTQRELGEHKVHISNLKSEAAELKAAIHHLREELKEAMAQVVATTGPSRQQSTWEMAKEAKHVRERTETGSLTNLVRTKSEPKTDLKRTYFENKVVSMLRSRKRDYVLKQILELAAKETHSTSEIEEIVVGEKALCGRTAFYDYMRELKHKRMIKQQEKGAKKVIFAEKTTLEQVR